MLWSYSILFLLWWVFSSQPHIFQDFYNERIMVFTKSHFYFYVMKYNYWLTYVKLSFHHLDEADSSWWMTILMFSYFFSFGKYFIGDFYVHIHRRFWLIYMWGFFCCFWMTVHFWYKYNAGFFQKEFGNILLLLCDVIWLVSELFLLWRSFRFLHWIHISQGFL